METETPTEAPAEETTAPTEETAAPTEETSAPTEATEETEEATEETVEDIALFADDGDVIASGECGKNGDNLTWVLTGDGTLTISGSGDIADFSKEKESNDGTYHTTAPWSRYWGEITAVVIESGVTEIGVSAFYGCIGLASVTIPDGVAVIDDSAFYDCLGLTSVTIPGSVTSIGKEVRSSIRPG
ncbi:MAG: leucine-rich repeat domain-containing protein [Oscillospiraceae bacterium]|nr:leucine-rich repeat domain-containing protein [Oscillospiraceae bacterium]